MFRLLSRNLRNIRLFEHMNAVLDERDWISATDPHTFTWSPLCLRAWNSKILCPCNLHLRKNPSFPRVVLTVLRHCELTKENVHLFLRAIDRAKWYRGIICKKMISIFNNFHTKLIDNSHFEDQANYQFPLQFFKRHYLFPMYVHFSAYLRW